MFQLRYLVVLSIVFTFLLCEGLKCRVQNQPSIVEEFNEIVQFCSQNRGFKLDNNNKNHHKEDTINNYNQRGKGIYGKTEEDDYDYGGGTEKKKTVKQNDKPNPKRHSRGLRQRNNKSHRNKNNQTINSSKETGSPLDNIEPCQIYCVFQEMEMLNDEANLDKSAVRVVLTERTEDEELKEFIEDSINECFDTIESDYIKGKCGFAKEIAICLEEKGKMNCEDWESGPGMIQDHYGPRDSRHKHKNN